MTLIPINAKGIWCAWGDNSVASSLFTKAVKPKIKIFGTGFDHGDAVTSQMICWVWGLNLTWADLHGLKTFTDVFYGVYARLWLNFRGSILTTDPAQIQLRAAGAGAFLRSHETAANIDSCCPWDTVSSLRNISNHINWLPGRNWLTSDEGKADYIEDRLHLFQPDRC